MKHDDSTPDEQHNGGRESPPLLHDKKSFLKNPWLWVSVSIAVLAVTAGAVIWALLNRPNQTASPKNHAANERQQQGSSHFKQQYGQNCKERDVVFSSAPMKPNELAYIRPLGAMGDGHVTPTDHVYIGGPNPDAADNTYPVLMPADGTVVEVGKMPSQYVGDRSGQQVASEDHRMIISHSCRYFSIYIHVHKLAPVLKTAVGDLQPNQNKQVQVELKAGDTVGFIGGSTFDWTPLDTTKQLKGYITPSLYNGESWKLHTVSPFDLYTGDLKKSLEAKSLRTVAPLGGKIDYDLPGKLIGNWFRQGSGGYTGNNDSPGGRYWDGHLSVVPDYIDPTSTIVSIGNWTGSAQQFVVSGSADPSKIAGKDGMVKYELKKFSYVGPGGSMWRGNSAVRGVHPSQDMPVEGVIAFQVLSGEKLKVEKFPSKTAAQVKGFTTAAQTYER